MNVDDLNLILGGLLGVHAGDALGAGVEFNSREYLLHNYPNMVRDITGGGVFNWDAGQATDDTDLTLALARSYVQCPNGGDELVYATADNLLKWYQGNPKDVGNATATSISSYQRTKNPFTSGCANTFSAGNGSLMRIVPVALARKFGDPRLLTEARSISAITHALPVCIESCVAYCVMVSAVIDGHDINKALDLAKSYCQDEEVITAINQAINCPLIEDLPAPHGGYVLHALRVAVWSAAHNKSFEGGVMDAVYLGEDTDTNGAIAGGLLGVMHGVNDIPARWLDVLQYKQEMNQLGIDLLNIRNS